VAPRGTPPAIEKRMAAELAKVLKLPDLEKRFEEQGVSAGDMTPEQLAGFIRSETAKWTKVARDSGATAD
jgi:tripartite-type tricarboxylate transporter receptor subunit TctC